MLKRYQWLAVVAIVFASGLELAAIFETNGHLIDKTFNDLHTFSRLGYLTVDGSNQPGSNQEFHDKGVYHESELV